MPLGIGDESALVAVPTPAPPPGTAFPPRRLTLRGEPVFELALWCGTCPAVFQKLSQPEIADVGVANERLNAGLEAIDDTVLTAYGRILPASIYTVLLLEVTPHLVAPGDGADYFCHEQVATWGIDPVTGAPENPGTPYYRTRETCVGQGGRLFEFVVPMVPPTWNSRERVAEYRAANLRNADYRDAATSATPVAVAYSLLDVVQPAMAEGDEYYPHWCLTHFLLDGHHKMEAAAIAGRPVRVLCFVDESACLATEDDLDAMVAARTRPW